MTIWQVPARLLTERSVTELQTGGISAAPEAVEERGGEGRQRPAGQLAEVAGRLCQVRQHAADLLPLRRARENVRRELLQLLPQLQDVPAHGSKCE